VYLAIVFHPFTLVQCIPFVKEAGAFTCPGSLKAATARPRRDHKNRRRVINKIYEFRSNFSINDNIYSDYILIELF